jgi:hypothetical protein
MWGQGSTARRLTTRNTCDLARPSVADQALPFGGQPNPPVSLGTFSLRGGPVGQNTLHLRNGIVRLDSHTHQYLSYLGRGVTRTEICLNN